MTIDAHTTQRELLALHERLARDEFLRNSPVNPRLFAGYAVLFILFPGMVLGFRVGIGMMIAVSIGIIVALVNGAEPVAERFVLSWLILGVAVFLWVTGYTLLKARKRWQMMRQTRPADAPLAPDAKITTCASVYPLKWKKSGQNGFYSTTLVLQCDVAGIWVVIPELEQVGRGRLLLPATPGICCPRRTNTDNTLRIPFFCKLAVGEHRLTWEFVTDQAPPSHAKATIVAKP